MKQKTEERPQEVIVSVGVKKHYLTVNTCIKEVEDGYEFLTYSTTLDHYPTQTDITEACYAAINEDTDEKILTGFVWQDIPVWLSTENQFNFKAAYDLAVQTAGASLPVKFKLGEDSDGRAIYHEFTTLEEFTDFYTSAIAYINQCLKEGWQKKDAIDGGDGNE